MRRYSIPSPALAHDAHNLIVAGINDADCDARRPDPEKGRGGLAVCCEGPVLAVLPLPLAGIFSDKAVDEVCGEAKQLKEALGQITRNHVAFASLSFLSLSVLPALRLITGGPVAVESFVWTSLYEQC